MLGGLVWFAIPFSLATSLGLAATALGVKLTPAEAGAGLVPPAIATILVGRSGAVAILIMLFMAIVSTGSAEMMAVGSISACASPTLCARVVRLRNGRRASHGLSIYSPHSHSHTDTAVRA
jgi:hypothetical protein